MAPCVLLVVDLCKKVNCARNGLSLNALQNNNHILQISDPSEVDRTELVSVCYFSFNLLMLPVEVQKMYFGKYLQCIQQNYVSP